MTIAQSTVLGRMGRDLSRRIAREPCSMASHDGSSSITFDRRGKDNRRWPAQKPGGTFSSPTPE